MIELIRFRYLYRAVTAEIITEYMVSQEALNTDYIII